MADVSNSGTVSTVSTPKTLITRGYTRVRGWLTSKAVALIIGLMALLLAGSIVYVGYIILSTISPITIITPITPPVHEQELLETIKAQRQELDDLKKAQKIAASQKASKSCGGWLYFW